MNWVQISFSELKEKRNPKIYNQMAWMCKLSDVLEMWIFQSVPSFIYIKGDYLVLGSLLLMNFINNLLSNS